MNLIPESNGFKRVNMKRKISNVGWVKRIFILIVGIFIFGLVFQAITYFIGNGKLNSSLNYTKVNGNKMEYSFKGSGDYTIVFDGAIGTTLYQWDEISDTIREELNVKTFVYNRKGYGFSDIATSRTPREQAMDLKILLRKAGVSGKLILIGEEYGSLIMTNFAKEYPDSVSAMILINPYSEEKIKSDEYKKKIKKTYNKSKLESKGTYFGLTILLDKLDKDITIKKFEDNLSEEVKKEFDIQKNRTSYRKAIESELENLYKYNDVSQEEGLLAEKPLYIIANNDDSKSLNKLGDGELTTVYSTDTSGNLISASDSESIVNALTKVLKERKKIDKANK
ncbi:MAG: alpha/beta hydrolase [Clostridium sp.]|nr:alpha/beta hydrolase [Clostridium sp.]